MIKQSKLPNLQTTIFTVMSQLASKHGALNLSQGFPNFDSDPVLIEAVAKAMKDGYNQYAPMQGSLKLREVLSHKIDSLYGKIYDPHTEITITAGATQAIFTALAAVIHPGDEVIVFAPAYDCYEPSIRLFGGVTKPIQLTPPYYRPNWQQVADTVTSNTKMIIINSPHNPSGMVFTKEDMMTLEELAVQHNLLVLSDEVYEHIIFDGESHQSAARFEALSQRVFITASFGKTFHNTGWKMGYCVASQALMKEFQKVHQFNVFSVNHPIQKGLAAYLQKPKHYLSLESFYEAKRDLFLNLITESRFQHIPSKGTYFQLLDYSNITDEPDIQFAERLTKDFKLATIPTSVFNKDQKDFKQLRVCFAKTEDTLEKAAAIINSI